MTRRDLQLAVVFAIAFGAPPLALAQTPVPFPKPGAPQKPQPTAPGTQTVAPPRPAGAPAPAQAPTDATLGMPIYPTADFIASYDAGRGQRYYIFGTNAGYAEIVNYYKSVLKQRGEVVYEEPPVHMFDVGRFREETMAFPPGVTVKDYTWGGSAGYLNPRFGAQPPRYKTIIQIVPAPAGAPR
jgi:hypothetical protein